MRTFIVRSGLLSVLLAFAPVAHGQLLGQSTNYQLAAVSMDGAGGGGSSVSYSLWAGVGEISGGQLVSTNFKSGVGFLEANDPKPTNAPIVFGVTPDFGNKVGGTNVVISGLNFDKFGTGPLVTVAVGGNSAARTVMSNTVINATTPAGIHGPQSVAVTNPFGTTTVPGAFIYTPAVTTTANAPLTSPFTMKNYGAVGSNFYSLVSLSTWSVNTRFGVLNVGGKEAILFLFQNFPYSGPDGIHTFTVPVPNMPSLHGITIYFQSLFVTSTGPVQGELTNLSQTFIP